MDVTVINLKKKKKKRNPNVGTFVKSHWCYWTFTRQHIWTYHVITTSFTNKQALSIKPRAINLVRRTS